MKTRRTRISWWAVTVLAGSFAAGSLAQAPLHPLTAGVIRAVGDARYATAGSNWKAIRTGDVLTQGASIQTGLRKDSLVDLAIGEGPLIRLWPNTALRLDQLSSRAAGNERAPEVQLDLLAGRVTGKIDQLPTGSKFEIKTPVAILGVLPPSVFEISSDGSASAASGTIVIVKTDRPDAVGTPIVVGPGRKYDARSESVETLPESARQELEKALRAPENPPPREPREQARPAPSQPRPQRKYLP